LIFKKLFAKEKTAYDLLLADLLSVDPQKVIKTAMIFGKKNHRQAIEPLISVLSSPNEKVRSAAAEALGNLAHYEESAMITPLIEALDDACDEVRFSAALALGKTEDEQALTPLISLLKQDTNPFVRDSAAKALENFYYEESLASLIKALSDNNEMVRSTAAVSLNSIILPDLINPIVKMSILPLIHSLKVIDNKGRCAAAEALGKIGDNRAIKHLERLLNDKKKEVQSAAQSAINNIREIIEYERARNASIDS